MWIKVIRNISLLWTLFVVGIIVISISFPMTTIMDRTKKCSEQATGVVQINERQDLYIKRTHNGDGPEEAWNTYVVVVNFDVDGKEQTARYTVSDTKYMNYPEGSSINIHYNPSDYSEIYIDGLENPGSAGGNVLFALGVIIIIGVPIATVVIIVKAIKVGMKSKADDED